MYQIFGSFEDALKRCNEQREKIENIYVIGGAIVYKVKKLKSNN